MFKNNDIVSWKLKPGIWTIKEERPPKYRIQFGTDAAASDWAEESDLTLIQRTVQPEPGVSPARPLMEPEKF